MKNNLTQVLAAKLIVWTLGIAAIGPVLASPMTYTAVVVTDIRVGATRYHNAAVTFKFSGDTNNIAAAVDGQGNPIQSTYCDSTQSWFYWLRQGAASVTVQSKGKTFTAHLAPGQVFLALDACNGGMGFGSFTGPNGFEVAYPLAFTLGTAMANAEGWGAQASALTSPANMSGDAWSCIGYPPLGAGNLNGTGFCAAPDSYPLHSDRGDLFFYQPYTDVSTTDGSINSNHNGSLNRGTFSITAATAE